MTYTESGDPAKSYYGNGGYVFYISNNFTEANKTLSLHYEEDFIYHGL